MFETGNIQSEANYNDTETGEYTEFYPSGKLKISGQYTEGKHDGIWKYYYEEGLIEGSCNYNQGTGYYKGYTPAGKLKIEGKLDGITKVGTWIMYDEKENVAGYYHNYDSPKIPVFSATVERKKTLPAGHFTTNIKNKRWDNFKKSQLMQSFKSNRPGLDALIISSDPLSPIIGKFNLNIELWVNKSFGHEIISQYYNQPILRRNNSLGYDEASTEGYALAYRHKIYNESVLSGFVHFDNEFRFTHITRSAKTVSSTQDEVNLKREENIYEYSFIFGHRFIKYNSKMRGKQTGLTLDAFFGIGVGYKTFKNNWQNTPEYNQIFDKTNNNPVKVPLRLGLNLGYSF